MNPIRNFAAAAGVIASLTCASAIAETPMTQPPGTQSQPSRQQPAPQPQTRTVNGLQLQPDGGSGPDKSKFNIVSKREAQKQQGEAAQRSGSSGMTSDGTGGGENSSGN